MEKEQAQADGKGSSLILVQAVTPEHPGTPSTPWPKAGLDVHPSSQR